MATQICGVSTIVCCGQIKWRYSATGASIGDRVLGECDSILSTVAGTKLDLGPLRLYITCVQGGQNLLHGSTGLKSYFLRITQYYGFEIMSVCFCKVAFH